MYQFVGDINGNKALGLESILNCINDNFHTKDDPAINQRNYNTEKELLSRFRNIQFKQNI